MILKVCSVVSLALITAGAALASPVAGLIVGGLAVAAFGWLWREV